MPLVHTPRRLSWGGVVITLRPYQREAVEAIFSYFSGASGNPLVVLPTGTGKSVCVAEFCRQAIEQYPETRILVLTHVRELIQQNYNAMLRMWANAPVGIYSAGLKRRDIKAQILFAGIQSIRNRAVEVQQCDLVLIDEAHLLGTDETSAYRSFLRDLNEINAGLLKVIGFTATPYRMLSGRLTDGKDRIFTDIAYEASMLDMIEQGYLCPVIPKQTETQLDVSAVGKRSGEFSPSQLEAAVDQQHITAAAVDEMVRLGEDRRSWLVFCSGVRHAEHVRDEIRKWDITCETVTGETPTAERDRILGAFKRGEIRSITNANVLTTGFDAPNIDLISLLRPTASPGLYVQMVGRGTRLFPGKSNCLILDNSGNTARHGPVDQVRGKRPGASDGDGVAPTKTCPECKTILAASARICDCGYEFPQPKINILALAATTAVLSNQVKAQWIPVSRVSVRRHVKAGKPDSLEVSYQCGLSTHREWVLLEYTGYPRVKACAWWNKRFPGEPVPNSVDEALKRISCDGNLMTIPCPEAIHVRPVGRYTEILGVKFHAPDGPK
jgi:DNA repair protein RadD